MTSANLLKSTSLQEKNVFLLSHARTDRLSIEGYTNRLFIHSYLDTDFENCLALYCDEEITKFFDNGKARTEQETFDYIQERGSRYFDEGLPYGLFSVFLKENDTFIGQVDLVPTGNPGEVEIGWIFHKEFQGKGYCTEAVLDFLLPLISKLHKNKFESNGLPLNRVIATAHPDNIASNKVIQKAGLNIYQFRLRYGGNPRNWYALNLTEPHQL